MYNYGALARGVRNSRNVISFSKVIRFQQQRTETTVVAENKNDESSGFEKIDTGVSNMEKTINQVTLLGRVGNEPQIRGTEKNPVSIFSLATHLNYKYANGDLMQKTEWHRVCVFKPSLRDVVQQYLRKGQRVFLTGRISYGEINDESGNTRPTTAIIADDIVFLQDGKKQ